MKEVTTETCCTRCECLALPTAGGEEMRDGLVLYDEHRGTAAQPVGSHSNGDI